MTPIAVTGLLAAALIQSPQTFSPDAEGFIRNWLILAPIAIQSESGASEVDRELIRGEATLKPKAGDTATAGSQLAWTAHETSDYFIDFLASFGKERGEYVAGYAVAYVIADEEMKVTLALSTNDQGKVWLNGRPIFAFAETRVLEKDTDRVEVALNKGQNVLMMKVINEVNNWQACARFLKSDAPVKNIKISLTPQ
jgi:hypothetical protein